jgi:hypothetical protein
VPAILQDPDEEENHPNANANLGNVFRMLDDDLRKALADTEQGMPGLPEGSQTYGEPFTVEAASAPAPTVNTPAQPIVTTPAPVVTSAPPAQMPPPRSRKAAPSAAAPAVATPPAPPATPAAITTAGPDTPATTAAPPPPGAKPPQRAPGT